MIKLKKLKIEFLIIIGVLCTILYYSFSSKSNDRIEQDGEEISGKNIVIIGHAPAYKATIEKLSKFTEEHYIMYNVKAEIEDVSIASIAGKFDKTSKVMHLGAFTKICYSDYTVTGQNFFIYLKNSLVTSSDVVNLSNPNFVIKANELVLNLETKNLILKGDVQTSIKLNHSTQ